MSRFVVGRGGNLIQAPAVEQIPLENTRGIDEFNRQMKQEKIKTLLCLTGIGTQLLIDALEKREGWAETLEMLSRLDVITRGAKPAAVLRQYGVPISFEIPEPNTWQEIMRGLSEPSRMNRYREGVMAIQEYGERSEALMEELRRLGIDPLPVPVYRWGMPGDRVPMEKAILAVMVSRVDLVLFTNRVQVEHVMRFATDSGWREELVESLAKTAVGSIGPVCSETLRDYRIPVTFEAPSPRMVPFLKKAAALWTPDQAERRCEAPVTLELSKADSLSALTHVRKMLEDAAGRKSPTG